jgi:hypothetical protein
MRGEITAESRWVAVAVCVKLPHILAGMQLAPKILPP